MKSCTVAGPKPTRFKFGYKEENSLCRKIKKAMLRQFQRLYSKKGVRRFYIGGILGVNLWAGELLLKLKEDPGYEDIELVVVLPFPGHDAKWDIRSRKRLEYLMRNSNEHLFFWTAELLSLAKWNHLLLLFQVLKYAHSCCLLPSSNS